MVLDALTVALQHRDPALRERVASALDALTRTVDGLRRPDGSWPALTDLTTAQREQLDARIGDFLEQAAPIPDVLEMPPDTNPD
jgi:high-affinity iron transporter